MIIVVFTIEPPQGMVHPCDPDSTDGRNVIVTFSHMYKILLLPFTDNEKNGRQLTMMYGP